MSLKAHERKKIIEAEDQIKVAAEVMIDKPLDMIRMILMKHETAVLEVMRELKDENDRLRDALEAVCKIECVDDLWKAQEILNGLK